MKLFGIRSCDTCREARAWLDEQGVDYDYVDIRTDGLDNGDLKRWEKLAGWEALLNRRSITWRKIPAVDREDLDAPAARRLTAALKAY